MNTKTRVNLKNMPKEIPLVKKAGFPLAMHFFAGKKKRK
jgi:hypothetical protein